MSCRKLIHILLLILSPQLAWGQANTLEIAYSGNIDGELEPCGCSIEGDLGGIMRHSSILKKLRQEHSDLIALSTGGLIASMVPQDKLTSEYIFKGFASLDYDAIGVQWSDLAYGDAFALKSKLNWVSSNRPDQGFSAQKTIRRGEHVLTFFSWLDPAASPAVAMQSEGEGQVNADVEGLKKVMANAQQDGLTVLATTLTLEQAQALPLENVDILFINSAYEVFGEPQRLGNTLVLQPGSRGMRLGQVSLSLNDDGRIDDFRHEVISMPTSIADDQALLNWYTEYNDQVKQAYLKRVELRKAQETGTSPYVGEMVCQSCHKEVHDIWRDTLHSHAFAKLEQVNKAFDPSCIQCHTVGFEQPGGFIDIDATPHLMNVQCESCHGAGRKHAESAGVQATLNRAWKPEKICAQCHVQKHSPSFDFNTYWSRIKHDVVK